jgi:Flp pilus assembly protein TadG
MMLLLTVAAGRLVQAHLQVDSAAQQAARAASLARDPVTAAADADATATAAPGQREPHLRRPGRQR